MKKHKKSAAQKKKIRAKFPIGELKQQLFNCTDGHALIRRHMEIEPRIIIFGVVQIFNQLAANFTAQGLLLHDIKPGTHEYLLEGLRLIGLPDVAQTARNRQLLSLAVFEFRAAVEALPVEQFEKSVANARFLCL